MTPWIVLLFALWVLVAASSLEGVQAENGSFSVIWICVTLRQYSSIGGHAWRLGKGC